MLERDRRAILFRRDFLVEFLKEKVPVSLVFAQEPALDDEWTELKEMEINESSIRILRKDTGTTGGK